MPLRQRSYLRVLFALAGLAAGFGVFGAVAGEASRPVVVELYTSQGCSSCPPADALLDRLAERKDVLALSLPITYWDMLGWKDTLASKANTDRQKAYARAMGRGGIYTPQMIVDGVKDIVGSRAHAVEAAIAAREADLQAVAVTLTRTPAELHVTVAAAKAKIKGARPATIWMLRIRPRTVVTIDAGENNGRTVTYRNVVRAVKAIGVWKGERVSLDLPRDAADDHDADGVAIIVQRSGYGAIIGATPIDRLVVAHKN